MELKGVEFQTSKGNSDDHLVEVKTTFHSLDDHLFIPLFRLLTDYRLDPCREVYIGMACYGLAYTLQDFLVCTRYETVL